MGTLDDFFGLGGKAALVTGAGRGIGRALACSLAAAGAAVACADLDGDTAAGAAASIEEDGGRAVGLAIDCADEASIVAGVAAAADQLGRLDVLVNNAGIYPYMTLETMDVAFIEQVLRVNLVGTMLCMREAVKPMREAGGGAIVNVASITAFRSVFPGEGAYGASKAAVDALTRSAALEFAPYGITVNAIAPGAIRTEGTQELFDLGLSDVLLARQMVKRVGESEDLAGIVIALAARAGQFVTGASIVIDGGYIQT